MLRPLIQTERKVKEEDIKTFEVNNEPKVNRLKFDGLGI